MSNYLKEPKIIKEGIITVNPDGSVLGTDFIVEGMTLDELQRVVEDRVVKAGYLILINMITRKIQ